MDYNVTIPELPQPEVNWKYGLSECNQKVVINAATQLPLSQGYSWELWAQKVFGFGDK